MSERMPCGMQDFDFSVTQIYDFAAVQNLCRRTLKNLILAYVKAFGQIATVNYHIADGLYRQRKFAVQPIQLGSVCIEIRKIFHWDHIGGHKYFAADFYAHKAELEWCAGNNLFDGNAAIVSSDRKYASGSVDG